MRTLASLLAAAALAACASQRDAMTASGGVDLHPGGRAEIHVTVPAGGTGTLRLENKGPGRVDFGARTAAGVDLAHGSKMTRVTIDLGTAVAPMEVLVVVEAYEDAGAAVDADLSVVGAIRGASISTNVTR